MRLLALLWMVVISGTVFAADGDRPSAIPLRKEYVGENLRVHEPVIYLTPEKLQTYEVQIKDGKFFNREGKLLSSYTWDLPSIYILGEDDKLYISLFQKHSQFHHSSLAQGGSVIAAGDIHLKDGVLLAFDNRSGHYMPGPERIEYMKRYLERHGVDMSHVKAYPDAAFQSLKGETGGGSGCLRNTLNGLFNH